MGVEDILIVNKVGSWCRSELIKADINLITNEKTLGKG